MNYSAMVTVGGPCVSQVFGRLGVLKPHFSRQIIPVAGEITENALGISDADRQHLESNVSVVIHLAATLSFTETLRYNADIISVSVTYSDLFQSAALMLTVGIKIKICQLSLSLFSVFSVTLSSFN